MTLNFRFHGHGTETLTAALSERCSEAERVLAKRVEKDTRPYVPVRSGSLVERTEVQGRFVVYPGPYAMMLYQGRVMVGEKTGRAFARRGEKKKSIDRKLVFRRAQARDHWFLAAKKENLTDWTIAVRKAVARNGGK